MHAVAHYNLRSRLSICLGVIGVCAGCVQVFTSCRQPEWWPLNKWQASTLRRRRSELEKVYAALQQQCRAMLASAGS